MIILGINEGHNASAAVLVDGRLVSAISEERLSRRKNEYGYPAQAVARCLRLAGVDAGEIDRVALATRRLPPKYFITRRDASFSIPDYWREQREYWYPRIYRNEKPAYLDVFKDKIDWDRFVYDRSLFKDEDDAEGMLEARLRHLEQALSIPRDRISVHDHHQCHACFGYFANPHRDRPVLVFAADGAGDGANGSVWLAEPGRPLKELARTHQCNIGRLYRYATLLLGMKQNEHEYKLMGLAPYANEYTAREAYRVYAETLQVDGLKFSYKIKPPDHFWYFKERLEGLRFDGIAYAVQKRTEELLTEWMLNGVRATGVSDLVFSGGVSLNVKANKCVWSRDEVRSLFVAPGPGDESIGIGAAYSAAAEASPGGAGEAIPPLDTAYLGADVPDAEVQRAIRETDAGAWCEVRTVQTGDVADLLAAGEVVARVAGRMEFGPRALGNRSILADPRNPQTVRIINEMIKKRDFWMPFTPSMLAERAADYVVNPKRIDARFMTMAFDSTPLARRDLPAALHPYDFTVRPQMVSRESNPAYHELLRAFQDRTGVGALLNTSFNLHGEPIVESPADGISVLRRSGLNHLLLGDCLLSKRVG
jgi:carbamoyltransferase